MSLAIAVIGLLLPSLAVTLVLRMTAGSPVNLWCLIGVGGLAGLLFGAASVFVWASLGLPLARWSLLLAWIFIAIVGVVTLAYRERYALPAEDESRQPECMRVSAQSEGIWYRLGVALLLLVILAHAIPIVTEVIVRPLYPYDATSAWATKAKVWSETGEFVRFVDKETWLNSDDTTLFTDHKPDYPIITPLLQLWTATLLGGWDVSLVNLPWILIYAYALVLLFGLLRELRIGSLGSLLATYVLASLPLFNTHIALAGYADALLGVSVCALLGVMVLWVRDREPWQLLILILFASACPLIKNEGAFWLLASVSGLMVGLVTPRFALWCAGVGAGLAAGLLLVVPEDFVFAGHSLQQLDLRYREGTLHATFRSQIALGSFGVLYGCALGTILLLTRMPRRNTCDDTVLLQLGLPLVLMHVLMYFLFSFTGYAPGTIGLTAVSRINLALIPSLVLFLAVALNRLFDMTKHEVSPERP